jgi:hypothetical protein
MGQRWHELLGEVVGDPASPATLVVNFNGTEVHSGTVPTVAPYVSEDNIIDCVALCSWPTDTELAGVLPVSVTVTNGDLKLKQITIGSFAPPGTPDTDPEPGAVFIENLDIPAGDTKTNVRINGIPVTKKIAHPELTGEWIWWVPAGSTIEFDYECQSIAPYSAP